MAGPGDTDDTERTGTLWFALLLTLANGFLDAHTYLARGGVFANVQTANVILFAIDVSQDKIAAALAHVWPLFAFIAGMLLASHIKSGRVDRIVARPLLWTMAVQSIALGIIGFVPASVPHSYVTVPISFLAAMQIGLFRKVGTWSIYRSPRPGTSCGSWSPDMTASWSGIPRRGGPSASTDRSSPHSPAAR